KRSVCLHLANRLVELGFQLRFVLTQTDTDICRLNAADQQGSGDFQHTIALFGTVARKNHIVILAVHAARLQVELGLLRSLIGADLSRVAKVLLYELQLAGRKRGTYRFTLQRFLEVSNGLFAFVSVGGQTFTRMRQAGQWAVG